MAAVKALSFGTLFLPTWALPWVVVVGLVAWIMGARALGVAAAILLLSDLVIAPLLAPWLATLPAWILWSLEALMWLMILHRVIETLFGKATAGHVTGTYLVRIFDALLLGPFRFVFRLLRGRGPGV